MANTRACAKQWGLIFTSLLLHKRAPAHFPQGASLMTDPDPGPNPDQTFEFSGPSIYSEPGSPYPVPDQPSSDATDQEEKSNSSKSNGWLSPHVPGWDNLNEGIQQKIAERVGGGLRVETVVLAADIRRSTFLMREARNPNDFAETLNRFVSKAQARIFKTGGWFDKFTGDGFLAYWPFGADLVKTAEDYDAKRVRLLLQSAVRACSTAKALFDDFNKDIIPRFRLNSQNFPEAAGLAMGMDSGEVSLVCVAGDLTIVGPAVVGSVRMTSAAGKANETVANVSLGEFLSRNESALRWHSTIPTEVRPEYRSTKEYPDGQEVYTIRFGAHTPKASGEKNIAGPAETSQKEKPPDSKSQGA